MRFIPTIEDALYSPKRPLSKSVSLVDVSSIISAHDEGKEKEKGNMATVRQTQYYFPLYH